MGVEQEPTPAAEASAERARAAARESAHWLREEASRLFEGYRRQSRFFKLRVKLAAVYAVIGIGSIVMALPPINTIRAYPTQVPSPDRVNVIIAVENQSSEDWTNVVLELDDKWRYSRQLVRPGERAQLEATSFTASESGGTTTPKPGYRPRKLSVRCDQGRYTTSLVD